MINTFLISPFNVIIPEAQNSDVIYVQNSKFIELTCYLQSKYAAVQVSRCWYACERSEIEKKQVTLDWSTSTRLSTSTTVQN